MMKVKLKEAMDSIPALNDLIANAKITLVQHKVLSDVIEKCNKEIEIFNKVYKEKVNKMFDLNEKGEGTIKEECKEQEEEFKKEVSDLLDYEFEIDKNKFTADDFKDVKITHVNWTFLNKWLIAA